MFRSIIFCLCASLIWATPASKGVSKVFPRNLPGSRIINGEQASPGQFPYQAALIVTGLDGSWFCGGSILNEEWILTAGHCVDGGYSGQVVTGSVDPYRGEVSEIAELVPHENYNGEQLANDIGLIRLAQPIRLGGNTEAIRLDSQPLREGEEVTVSGWGLTRDGSESISDVLNYVNLVTISNRECEQTYGAIGEEVVCANSNNGQVKSTCSGDSGGPLVTGGGLQVGVVSFVADSGCESGAPSGYTRVAPYVDWIRRHTG